MLWRVSAFMNVLVNYGFYANVILAPELRCDSPNEADRMNDIIILALIVVAVPIIALIIFLNFAKPKRRRRPVSNFR
jgi:hypothetical protein